VAVMTEHELYQLHIVFDISQSALFVGHSASRTFMDIVKPWRCYCWN